MSARGRGTRRSQRPRHRWSTVGTWIALVCSAALCAGVGIPAASAAAPSGSGPVDVLYAGSLTDLMQYHIGPTFQKATGYTFTGFSGGSTLLASEIKSGTRDGDVFVSASPAVDATLEGTANGNHVSWYLTFGTSTLVLGYNPQSTFAHQLEHRPWYDVVTEPGFRLGRTDPQLDPKGALAVQAIDQAATTEHDPGLKHLLRTTAEVFPETALAGRLQTGQLDAAFFYKVEATAASIPTVPLTPTHLAAQYTITVLNGAVHEAGALAFIEYLLGKPGAKALAAVGMREVPPVPHGGAVPHGLRTLVHR